MYEWILVVWLMVPGGAVADPIEIGEYNFEERCVAARDSIEPAEGVTFIARCVLRPKQ